MDNECTYGKSYMTCMTNTRIFDEDSNGGYTATMMEGLKHCQVFNEDGTPRVLDGLSSPIDAGDLRSVFWLRPEVDSTGAEVFKNIEIMGDIDPVFFGTDDLANLTRTWTKSLVNSGRESDDEARKIDQRLTAGAALVSRLSMMPITDASGDFTAFGPANTADAWQRAIAGVTTYKGLQALETAGGQRPEAIVAREFIEALDNVVPKLQMTMGGKENMFLNPANSLPMYGAGSAARTLYENLFNYNSVPLYVARDVSPAGAVSPLLTEAVSRTQKALRTPGARTAAEWTDAGVDLAAYTAIYNGLTNSAQLGAADQRVAIDRALDYIFAHTAVAKTTNVNNIRAWVGQMRELVGQASAQQATRQRTGAGGGAPVVSQNLAVSRQHPQLAPNAATSLRSLGYLPASRLDVTEPAGVYEAGDQTAPTVLTIGSKASLFETMPIMQSVLSETSARATQKGGARGAGARGFGSLFGEDDDVDDVNQPIGSLLGGGRQMHRQTQAIADRRRYLAQTGVVLSEGVDSRLRFGTLAYNLEQLEQSSIGGLGRAVAAVYLAAPWRRQTLEGFLTHNVMPNFGFLGFRIGLYDMALGIKVPFFVRFFLMQCALHLTHSSHCAVQGWGRHGHHVLWQLALHAVRRCHDHDALRELHPLRQVRGAQVIFEPSSWSENLTGEKKASERLHCLRHCPQPLPGRHGCQAVHAPIAVQCRAGPQHPRHLLGHGALCREDLSHRHGHGWSLLQLHGQRHAR